MSTNLFKDLALTTAQIDSNYPLRQLKILNDAQIATNTTQNGINDAANDSITKLNSLNTCVSSDTTSNTVYGRENLIVNMQDNGANVIIGNSKTQTANAGKPFEHTTSCVVVGGGILTNGDVVVPHSIMIGHGCRPPDAANIAFGSALEPVDGTALNAAGDLTRRVHIWYNGVKYWLYLRPA